MKLRSCSTACLVLLLSSVLFGADDLPIERIKLLPGFKIEVFVDDLPGARSMVLTPNGILFVGTRGQRKVYAVLDKDKNGKADQKITVLNELSMPNGVAFRDGALYVAEVSRVLKYEGIEQRLSNPPRPIVVNDRFPNDDHHGWKFIAFGPDGKLYVPVGAPCNICKSEDPIYASITRMDPDGKNREVFAHGVRNTVGFDWDPVTKELWFTDNGRDMMGDDLPPDELNHATKTGQHYGYPYCHGQGITDPKYGDERACKEFVPAAINLGPHVAGLGLRFYTGKMFPAEYKNQIFIAEHGSWNRSSPLGYRLSLVRVKDGKAVKYETFAEGWLSNGSVWGRPVDVLVMPDGALLVSDDHAGAIYRITYKG